MFQSISIRNALIAAGLTGLAVWAALPADAQSVQSAQSFGGRSEYRTPIFALPYTISVPGSYVLAGDLTGVTGESGIRITVDDVTLDLNGFTLTGVAGSLAGIAVSNSPENITVMNGSVVSWDEKGLGLGGATSVAVRSVKCRNNGDAGIKVGQNSTLEDCLAASNGDDGIIAGQFSLLRDCHARDNLGAGVDGDAYVTAVSCFAQGNTLDGIVLTDGGNADRCTAVSNGQDGIQVRARSLVASCVSRSNGGNGFDIAFHTKIRDSIASENTGAGIEESIGTDSYIDGNIVAENSGGGIVIGENKTVVSRNHVLTGGINLSGRDVAPVANADSATNPFSNFDT